MTWINATHMDDTDGILDNQARKKISTLMDNQGVTEILSGATQCGKANTRI